MAKKTRRQVSYRPFSLLDIIILYNKKVTTMLATIIPAYKIPVNSEQVNFKSPCYFCRSDPSKIKGHS